MSFVVVVVVAVVVMAVVVIMAVVVVVVVVVVMAVVVRSTLLYGRFWQKKGLRANLCRWLFLFIFEAYFQFFD